MFPAFYRKLPTYQRMQKAIHQLGRSCRRLKIFPIGKSVLGRDITALSIGDPVHSVLYVGATHGLEWLTSMLLLQFCQELVQAMKTGGCVSDVNICHILGRHSITIIPCLNPDGVEIALQGPESAGDMADYVEELCGGMDSRSIWQANANGVDLNHNFDAGWQIVKAMEQEQCIFSPAPTRYGGLYPHSEPESRAISEFCKTFQPRALYSFHSQGEEIYWHYGGRTPARSKMMGQILAASSGYQLSQPEGLASHGGLKDWFIQSFGRPGFTIEVGKGKNPLTLEQLAPIYCQIQEMLVLAMLL